MPKHSLSLAPPTQAVTSYKAAPQGARQYAVATVAVALVLTLPIMSDQRSIDAWQDKLTLGREAGTRPTIEIAAASVPAKKKRRLRERMEELERAITPEQLAQTPPNLAANVDRIVYG